MSGFDLEAYAAALLARDLPALARFVAPGFGAEGSTDALAVLAGEADVLAERLAAFGEGGRPRLAPLAEWPGGLTFGFVTDRGGLVYEDTLHLDAGGLVTGDAKPFETCGKLRLSPGAAPRRAVAIRPWGMSVDRAVPLGMPAEDALLAAAGPDGFADLSFRIPGDDLSTRRAVLAVAAGGGVHRVRVELRGADHPHFRGALHPRVRGREVLLPAGANPWALSVRLADGRSTVLRNPAGPRVLLGAQVASATLTDGIGHDWEAEFLDS